MNDGTTSNDDRLGAIGDIRFVLDSLGLDEELVVVAGTTSSAPTSPGSSSGGERSTPP